MPTTEVKGQRTQIRELQHIPNDMGNHIGVEVARAAVEQTVGVVDGEGVNIAWIARVGVWGGCCRRHKHPWNRDRVWV